MTIFPVSYLSIKYSGSSVIKDFRARISGESSNGPSANNLVESSTNITCPSVTYNHTIMPHESELDGQLYDLYLTQREKMLQMFNGTEFIVYTLIQDLPSKMHHYNWTNDRDIILYVRQSNMGRLDGAKIIDANIIKLYDSTTLVTSRCNYTESKSCLANFQYSSFLDVSLSKTDRYMLQVHWNVTNSSQYNNLFLQQVSLNELYSTELDNDCAEFMKSLF